MKNKREKKKPELWVETMCRMLAPVERKTVRALGKKRAHFFTNVYLDCVEIVSTMSESHPADRRMNLVFHAATGLMKEVQWLNTLFLAGNYPLLKARLRFNWELMFRAHFIETYQQTDPKKPPTPGPSIGEKFAWWDEHGGFMNWPNCLEPTLRTVFPLADREKGVRDFYHDHLKDLHRYVHPSAYLADRLLDDSALHAWNNFDKKWAEETLNTAAVVFDVIWLTVLEFHKDAGDRLFSMGLLGDYPVVSMILKSDKAHRRAR